MSPIDSDKVLENFAQAIGCKLDGMALITGREPTEDQFEILTWALYNMGREQSASAYLMAVTALQALSRQVAHMFIDFDIWVVWS